MNTIDQLIFGVLPYLAMALFFIETIRRYVTEKYSYTTMSSQFLENKQHFWGMMAFHYGIIGTIAGHIIAFLLPKSVLWWNSYPIRLYILEATAFIFGALSLFGVAAIIYRRISNPRVKVTTRFTDWIIYLFLTVVIVTGVYIAMFHGWGTSWFAASVTPYLWSLVKFQPQIEYVASLPPVFKTHFFCVFILIALFPFTKLVHILVAPNQYMLRKRQVVRWRWGRKPSFD